MFREFSAGAIVSLLVLTGCGSRHSNPVEDLGGKSDASAFVLRSVKGTRDGERLHVQAFYQAGASQSLQVDLQFNVTPPARLSSGSWNGPEGEVRVRQRSVTFLGGQSGPPSIGGKFDLIGRNDQPMYRITIPLQELKQPL